MTVCVRILVVLVSCRIINGFVVPISDRRSVSLYTQEYSGEDDGVFFDDFEGLSIGESSSTTPALNVLKDRLDKVQNSELRQSAVQNRNWKLANWQESCVKLDESDVPISCLGHDQDCLYIGRDNGSVVKLHTDPAEVLDTYCLSSQPISRIDILDEVLVASSSGGTAITRLDLDTGTTTTMDHPAGAVTFFKLFESSILVSASANCAATWDSESGELLGNITLPNGVSCFDADDAHLYVGTADGSVFVYKMSDIKRSFANVSGQFQANKEGLPVTAIAVGEETTLGGRQTAKAVFVGDITGSLKQFFVFGEDKLESFPKMASQRLPKKAHLFEGTHKEIRNIVVIDSLKVICTDDTVMRAYNANTGKELFHMEGFENLKSICLFHNKLYTDGMKGFISIHDFTIEEGDDFDLEMPEYRDG